MAICVTCGNDYAKSFELSLADKTYTFDCFECAIHKLAPCCNHCQCKIIGHGVETENQIFCCANCAHAEGVDDLKDHA